MYILRLARLGQTMEEGVIGDWLKSEGDSVAIGDEIYDVVTEKANMTVESTRAGRIVRLLAQSGDLVPVGGPLALIAEGDELNSPQEIDAALRGAGLLKEDAGAGKSEKVASGDAAKPADTPKTGEARRPTAVPAARQLASDLGIDLTLIAGSGPDGLITAADVRAMADQRK